jgi:hypothetical protein
MNVILSEAKDLVRTRSFGPMTGRTALRMTE